MRNRKQNRVFVILLAVVAVLSFLIVFYDDDDSDQESQSGNVEQTVNDVDQTGKNDEVQPETVAETVAEAAPESVPAETPSSKNEDIEGGAAAPEEPIEKDKNSEVDAEGFVHGKILPKKGFEEALLKLPGVQLSHTMEIINAIRYDVDLSQIKAGEDFKVKLSKEGAVEEFVFYPDIITFHTLKRDPADNKLKYSLKKMPTVSKYRIIEGEVETTLNQALIDREDVTRTIRAVTNGILECIVSFRTDARKGDKFRILVEDKFYNDQLVPGSKILYASYEGKRAGFNEAFRFEDEDPKSAFNAHYTKTGKALIPSAMRLPVDRVHITSPFGMRRHPVTGQRSFHNGVDYGGPVGAPIYAVAPGKVIEVKTTDYGGKQIAIQHADRSQTYYLHLNSFLVKQGATVGPRQKIATMGRTGRVTGPHLHFGIKSPKGEWLNPLKIKMIASPQLEGPKFNKFKSQMKEISELLNNTEKYQEWLRKYDEGPQPEEFYRQYEL